jgi:hypothetical protein
MTVGGDLCVLVGRFGGESRGFFGSPFAIDAEVIQSLPDVVPLLWSPNESR